MRKFGAKWLKAREDFDRHRERVPVRIRCYGPERKSCPRSNVEIDDRMADFESDGVQILRRHLSLLRIKSRLVFMTRLTAITVM